jgi:hypothetical protein
LAHRLIGEPIPVPEMSFPAAMAMRFQFASLV